MAAIDNQADRTATWRSTRHRMRLECRECDAICERVVHPWHCLKSKCEYVYSYEDEETMLFGCLYKVFTAEFDMAYFVDPGCRPGGPDRMGSRPLKSNDPYGPVRVIRPPRPQCKVKVEQAYESASGQCCCSNPTFFHHPFGVGDDAMKLTATPSGEDPPPDN